jgi:hypothetical protein
MKFGSLLFNFFLSDSLWFFNARFCFGDDAEEVNKREEEIDEEPEPDEEDCCGDDAEEVNKREEEIDEEPEPDEEELDEEMEAKKEEEDEQLGEEDEEESFIFLIRNKK